MCSCHAKQNIILESVTLESKSRGYSSTVHITSGHLSHKTSGPNNSSSSSRSVTSMEWFKLQKAVSQLDLDQIEKLEGPSNERASDKSYTTYLTVKIKYHEAYKSLSFDAVNPPKMLSKIVRLMTELKPK